MSEILGRLDARQRFADDTKETLPPLPAWSEQETRLIYEQAMRMAENGDREFGECVDEAERCLQLTLEKTGGWRDHPRKQWWSLFQQLERSEPLEFEEALHKLFPQSKEDLEKGTEALKLLLDYMRWKIEFRSFPDIELELLTKSLEDEGLRAYELDDLEKWWGKFQEDLPLIKESGSVRAYFANTLRDRMTIEDDGLALSD